MKEKFKIIFINKSFKIIFILLLWLFILREIYTINIDIYNFKQLEKAKIILKDLPKESDKFYWLKEFNEKYGANIKPIKNCYDISNDNWKYPYIFWFKLESILYKIKYSNIFYSYPKYDFEVVNNCIIWGWCFDINYELFSKTISNPCQD
jgi:hypothetical protein